MAEVVQQLGSDRRVLAVMTPADPINAHPPLGCILVNAGVIHRVGPHRINVKLARSLASQGICSIRVDLSGRGDTPADPRSSRSLSQQSVHDIRLAMDALQQTYGCQQFIMFGICSGAVNATDTAVIDHRLIGVCLMDGHAYLTWQSRLRHTLHYIKSRSLLALGRTIIRKVSERVGAMGATSNSRARAPVNNRGLGFLARETYANTLETITQRGGQVYVIYSGSIQEHYNYERQFEDVFGRTTFHGRVRCDYLPQIDHTLTTLANQRILIDRFSAWSRQFGEREHKSTRS